MTIGKVPLLCLNCGNAMRIARTREVPPNAVRVQHSCCIQCADWDDAIEEGYVDAQGRHLHADGLPFIGIEGLRLKESEGRRDVKEQLQRLEKHGQWVNLDGLKHLRHGDVYRILPSRALRLAICDPWYDEERKSWRIRFDNTLDLDPDEVPF